MMNDGRYFSDEHFIFKKNGVFWLNEIMDKFTNSKGN